MKNEIITILLELLAVGALIAFCVVVWWPAALLVVAIAAGAAAWNENRKGQKR